MASSFQVSELASWLSTSFLLTSMSSQPLYGRLSDVMGRKITLCFRASSVFTAATLWCTLAGSTMSFVAARAVCGIGACGMVTMYASLHSTPLHSTPQQRRAFALTSLFSFVLSCWAGAP